MINKYLNDKNQIEEFLKTFFINNSNQTVKELIEKDAEFLFKNDPSASDIDQIKCYTSFFAVACFRIAHIQKDKTLARQITEYAKSVTGVDIHPDATIGSPFCIDHGVGTVIGQTAIIGNNCMLYHGVTLGAKHLKEREQVGVARHPKLEDSVIIYSNTTILGNITIPKNSMIGANKFIKNQKELDEYLGNK
ncbi:MAG: hypothetical protein FWD32_00490 [Firmicutes bacterium]|nr:hypothetical protein [Bacillota bacterium]